MCAKVAGGPPQLGEAASLGSRPHTEESFGRSKCEFQKRWQAEHAEGWLGWVGSAGTARGRALRGLAEAPVAVGNEPWKGKNSGALAARPAGQGRRHGQRGSGMSAWRQKQCAGKWGGWVEKGGHTAHGCVLMGGLERARRKMQE